MCRGWHAHPFKKPLHARARRSSRPQITAVSAEFAGEIYTLPCRTARTRDPLGAHSHRRPDLHASLGPANLPLTANLATEWGGNGPSSPTRQRVLRPDHARGLQSAGRSLSDLRPPSARQASSHRRLDEDSRSATTRGYGFTFGAMGQQSPEIYKKRIQPSGLRPYRPDKHLRQLLARRQIEEDADLVRETRAEDRTFSDTRDDRRAILRYRDAGVTTIRHGCAARRWTSVSSPRKLMDGVAAVGIRAGPRYRDAAAKMRQGRSGREQRRPRARSTVIRACDMLSVSSSSSVVDTGGACSRSVRSCVCRRLHGRTSGPAPGGASVSAGVAGSWSVGPRSAGR